MRHICSKAWKESKTERERVSVKAEASMKWNCTHRNQPLTMMYETKRRDRNTDNEMNKVMDNASYYYYVFL